MKKTKRKNPTADGIGSLAVIRKKPDQAMTKAEMASMLNGMRGVLLRMTEYMESVAADAKKTKQLVQELHKWDSLRPHASNFNRLLQEEGEKAEVRRKEREEAAARSGRDGRED